MNRVRLSTTVCTLLIVLCATSGVSAQPEPPPDLLPGPVDAPFEEEPLPGGEEYYPQTPASMLMNWPRHRDPNDGARHRGIGEPLVGTSWLNRPYHFDWMVGGVFGDDLISGQVEQGNTLGGGFRLGLDFDHYYGTEMRFLFYELDVRGPDQVSIGTSNQSYMWDVHFHYYPWGDARWRPFAGLGLGFSGVSFVDSQGRTVEETMLQLPISLGIKYQIHRWSAIRADFTNNIAFGAGQVGSRNDITLTLGMEFRFGAHRSHRRYFPYH